MNDTSKQATGAWGEAQAVSFLLDKGYIIVARNYTLVAHGKKKGEIDIIARHKKVNTPNNTLCFIEVKTRGLDDGSAERATGKKKLTALFAAAKAYCFEHAIDTNSTPIQFEQVSIYKKNSGEVGVVHHEIPIV